MTDRHAGSLVTLKNDTRDDDAEAIITALRMVKGVIDVTPVVSDLNLKMAEQRADLAWRERLAGLLREPQ